jgi:hypothetical protein
MHLKQARNEAELSDTRLEIICEAFVIVVLQEHSETAFKQAWL